MGRFARLRGVLSAALVAALVIAGAAVPAPAAAATADTTIAVGAGVVGSFTGDMLGANLTPWGAYWPSAQYNTLIPDMGLGLMRIGHGEKWFVDMEKWYPTKGGTPNWDAPGELGVGHTFTEQIAWWNSLKMPLIYTFNDELSSAMLNQDGSLNYAEVARAWALHLDHLMDAGLDIRWVEIGNECDINPMEGIELPPVAGSSKAATGKYVDPSVQPAASNQYIKIYEAAYPALKAVAAQHGVDLKISAYPSGSMPATIVWFPFDYLLTQSPYTPDFYPIHVYPFASASTPAQQVLDSTWQGGGAFVDPNTGTSKMTIAEVLAGYGVPNLPTAITEFNYDGGGSYASANQMWDAVYYASLITNAANGGIDLTTHWELFAGSNTDELISDIYQDPTPTLRSQALAMRLLKQFKGASVRTASVTSADNAVAYDWENKLVDIPGLAGKRVECLATTDASGYRLLVINKNATTAHTANVTLAGFDTGTAAIKTYSSRAALADNAPSSTTASLSGGQFQLALPAMSVAVVTVDGPTPPPITDTTPPQVAIASPADGATVTGFVPIAATATDTDSGVARVEFRVDGKLLSTDASAPYTALWDASLAISGDHTISARAIDVAGNPATTSITVNVEGLEASLLSLAASPTAVDWGAKPAVKGTLRDGGAAPLGGDVRISRSFDRSAWAFCATATVGAGGVPGAFAYADTRGATRKTYYRAQFLGDADYAPSEAIASVAPRVKFATPAAPYAIASGSRARVTGWMYPRHTARTKCVKVVAWRKEGTKWVPRAWVWASVSNGPWSRSNYVGSIRLSGRGLWKVAAYHPADSLHAATYSPGRLIRVR